MIQKIFESYEKSAITIGTIGSHSALQIFKGAKEEGFRTVCICKKNDEIVYERFPLADELLIVEEYEELFHKELQEKLIEKNVILIPHGSFNAYLDAKKMVNDLHVPLFGNRKLLFWETDRNLQREWLRKAGLRTPITYKSTDTIRGLVIAKFPGAHGGRGYFIISSKEAFHKKSEELIRKGLLRREELDKVVLQEYVIGVNLYPSYFHSPLLNRVEFFGVDKRYESTADNIGRIPSIEQLKMKLNPSYTIVGNIPLTVRESLLPELIRMGDRVVETSKKIASPGIIGPFCLETVITETLKIVAFEISARIVAGANVGIGISPYTYLLYEEPMYMGKRIARELKDAIAKNLLEKVLT